MILHSLENTQLLAWEGPGLWMLRVRVVVGQAQGSPQSGLSPPVVLGSPHSSPRADLESGGGLRQRPGVTEGFVHTGEHLCTCIHSPSEKRAGWRDPERCHSTNAVRATHCEARRPNSIWSGGEGGCLFVSNKHHGRYRNK